VPVIRERWAFQISVPVIRERWAFQISVRHYFDGGFPAAANFASRAAFLSFVAAGLT
jgi:hypothetical protein